jgi:hypothetical protein
LYLGFFSFKHPNPQDLQKVFVQKTGKSLEWFFEDLLTTSYPLDYKVNFAGYSFDNLSFDVVVSNIGDIASPVVVSALKNGKVVTDQEIHTTEKAYKIELSYMMDQFVERDMIPELIADGRDIVIIKAAIMDEENNVVPTAGNLVNFSIEGDAKIIGVGNGNIDSHEPNKANYRLAYNGLCAVIIQSTNKVGKFTLKAESDGLNSDEIEIKTASPVATSIGVITKPHSISSNYETTVITAEVRDKFGIVIPSSEKNLIFKLNGPAQFENEEKQFEVAAIDGKATVKIKSTDQTGEAYITVFSEGLISGKVNLLIR